MIGRVASGRGLARDHLRDHQDELASLAGGPLWPGTLNLTFARPLSLRNDTARRLAAEPRMMFWPAKAGGEDVLLYRWPDCPLVVVELLATRHLRSDWALQDGDPLTIEIAEAHMAPVPPKAWIGWSLIWCGREARYYQDDRYVRRVSYVEDLLGLHQLPRSAPELIRLALRALRKRLRALALRL